MRFDVLTLFPEMIEGMIKDSILKRAIEKGIIEVNIINFRDFSTNKHHTVDDYAYGGGAGMLISVEPIHKALMSIENIENAKVVLTSPSGNVWTQKKAYEYSNNEHIVIICGHYEGIDNRILKYVDEEISIGDYVLTGGEIAATVLIDSISRLVKDVISEDSTVNESHQGSLLEYPQYTRPLEYDGEKVPEVLYSGHHANIKKFQRYESLKKTYRVRPDLLEKANLMFTTQRLLSHLR